MQTINGQTLSPGSPRGRPTDNAVHDRSVFPSDSELVAFHDERYPRTKAHGWRVRARHAFGFHSPNMVYSAVVQRLVLPSTRWLDVGGGKSILPNDDGLAKSLSDRCSLLVGVDPSSNIHENPFAHERVQATIEEYETDHRFDLATLRMVAEHITDPDSAVSALARLIVPGGNVVILTPNRLSPSAIAARLSPNRVHPHVTRILWRTKDEDVFPTVYRLNTRQALRSVLGRHGFQEVAFRRLDDCSLLQRFKVTCYSELLLWRALHILRIGYPESVLLGIYRRTDQ